MIILTMDELITRMVTQQKRATSTELVNITNYVVAAPFATDLLEVDEPLWGSFWQYDVIAPGYTLPAIELALLRAIRLDENWPEDTTIDQYLADLRQAILHPQAGIWTLSLSKEPFIIFASPIEHQNEPDKNPKSKIVNHKSTTVVWYCASTCQLHAGYKVATGPLHFAGANVQREPEFRYERKTVKNETPDWIALAIQQLAINEESSLAARIDAEILRLRLGE